MNSKQRELDREAYAEFERKMDLLENGPRTTNFQQLLDRGTELPEPGSIPDDRIRAKVWQVLAGLASLGVYLDQTDHLSDRDLYAKLWNDVLRQEVAAFDEFGSDHVMMLQPDGVEPDTSTFFRYFADERWRGEFSKENPEFLMPEHEDPPHNRDCLLPIAPGGGLAEASTWLGANWSPSAFASNRFGTTQAAIAFVEQLYAAGAEAVAIDNVMMLPDHDWTPYADTLIVKLPEEASRRRDLFDLMEHVGKPDEDGPDFADLLIDSGQDRVRLWWD
jgi:hypothetical protein